MKKDIPAAILKCLIFVSFLTAIIYGVKQTPALPPYPAGSEKMNGNNTVFSIGSSRLQVAITEHLYNTKAQSTHMVNLSGSLQTFLYNYLLADQLMEKEKNNTFIIELCILNARTPETASMLTRSKQFFRQIKNIYPLFPPFARKQILLPFSENNLSDYARLTWDLKVLTRLESPVIHKGYYFQNRVLKDPVLFPVSGANPEEVSDEERETENLYLKLIRLLAKKASTTGNRLFFVLPYAFNSSEERQRLINVFHRIPENNRLHFSAALKSVVVNPEFYADQIHFNQRGAQIYTDFLLETIDKP